MSREQLKSDQPCLQIADCEVVIEEINEGESDRGASQKVSAQKEDDSMKHVKLNEEQSSTHGEDNFDPKAHNHSPIIAPSQNEEEDVVLFVEMKYCTICHIE